ncbi:MAG: exopolyphosphatase, partial [Streptosporangiaceae bacterium]
CRSPEIRNLPFVVRAEYTQMVGGSGVCAVRPAPPGATRDASNAGEFAAGVRRVLGVDPEVVSGAEEARLSFSGATAELGRPEPAATGPGGSAGTSGAVGPEPPFLVVDIGGGSTEFVVGRPGAARDLAALSVDIGCVRLTERHLRDDPPRPEQIEAARADIDAALARVAATVPAATARTLVGLAGSVTTLTAVALNLAAYDPARIHHAWISAEQVREVTGRLLRLDHAGRAAIAVIHSGRVDVIGAGALILDRILDTFGFDGLVTSEHDILDGIAWSLVTGAATGSSARP